MENQKETEVVGDTPSQETENENIIDYKDKYRMLKRKLKCLLYVST